MADGTGPNRAPARTSSADGRSYEGPPVPPREDPTPLSPPPEGPPVPPGPRIGEPEGPILPPRPGRTAGHGNKSDTGSGRNWSWILATLGVLLVGAAILAWLTFRGSPPEVSPPPPPLVNAARAVAADRLAIRQTGFIRPLAEIQVATEFDGRIEEVSPSFRRGNFVEAGEVLVRLETRQLRAAVARAEADVARAEAALAEARVERDRQEQLEAREFASEAQLQQAIVAVASAEADLTSARAELVTARTRLSDSVVVAPFDALVLADDADVGAIATPGQSLGRLVASEAVEVELGLTPADLGILGDATLAIGGRVAVGATNATTGPEREAPLAYGVVTRTGPAVDPDTRTIPLIVRIPRPFEPRNDARPLRVNELVELELPVSLVRGNVLSIPVRAVKGGDVVWEVVPMPDDGRDEPSSGEDAPEQRHVLRRRDVVVIQRTETRAILEGGNTLQAGALVMTSDLSGVADGVPVRVASRQDDQAGPQDGGDGS
ncbi:Multidrug transporter MdtA [Jannaschia seosinensis]|uniref:Multidrug transporter MdtA n=1 Tax=Jannaschia seosinensis TaxID=313367 RepID=A0A0M7BE76_9RHOB|nr:efflux RND transporter periplasmic adaptor subunit [Jannaschia seosinensis]CUH40388.1 Multidrug transporter MdtA [Jannaschia seosinensis]